MQLFLSKLVSAVLETILFALVPFIWWAATARKRKEPFFKWTGLTGTGRDKRKAAVVSALIVTVIFAAFSVFMLYAVRDVETAASEFAGLGASGIPAALVYAILGTSLPEELLFRGFLLKRMQNKLGFVTANIIQSCIFGAVHGVMFFSLVSPLLAAAITLFTGVIAFAMGWINEKKAGGSILPSWFVHAVANIASAFVALFSII